MSVGLLQALLPPWQDGQVLIKGLVHALHQLVLEDPENLAPAPKYNLEGVNGLEIEVEMVRL